MRQPMLYYRRIIRFTYYFIYFPLSLLGLTRSVYSSLLISNPLWMMHHFYCGNTLTIKFFLLFNFYKCQVIINCIFMNCHFTNYNILINSSKKGWIENNCFSFLIVTLDLHFWMQNGCYIVLKACYHRWALTNIFIHSWLIINIIQ